MFTVGFYIGAIFSFILFARKKLDEEEYGIVTKQPLEPLLSDSSLTFGLKTQVKSSSDKTNGSKRDQIPQPDRKWLPVN